MKIGIPILIEYPQKVRLEEEGLLVDAACLLIQASVNIACSVSHVYAPFLKFETRTRSTYLSQMSEKLRQSPLVKQVEQLHPSIILPLTLCVIKHAGKAVFGIPPEMNQV